MTYNQKHANRLAITERLLTEVMRICNFSDPKDIENVEVVSYHLGWPIYSVIPSKILVWRNPFGDYTESPKSEAQILREYDDLELQFRVRKTLEQF